MQEKYKILTWNLLENRDYIGRLPEMIKFIKDWGADIVLLQETADEFDAEATAAWSAAGYVYRSQMGGAGYASGVAIAYDPQVWQESPHGAGLAVNFRAIALDLLPVDKTPEQRPPRFITKHAPHPETPVDYGNDFLTVISYHGKWGAFAQPQRLEEVLLLDSFAKSKNNAVILGGDFNAMSSEPAVEFLRGNQVASSEVVQKVFGAENFEVELFPDRFIPRDATYWVEAQDLANELTGARPYATSLAHGKVVGQQFDMAHMIERRIDFLFDFGFSYGRQYAFSGTAAGFDFERVRELSDHAPVGARLLTGI